MQKQWGLFLGALAFYAATLVVISVAGPDPYPLRRTSGGVTQWRSRSAYVEMQIESAALVLAVGAIVFLLFAWRPWWLRHRATRAYWTARLPQYRRIIIPSMLRLASITAIGFGLGHLATVALPASTAGRTALAFAVSGALFVEIVRGVWRLRLKRDPQASVAPVPSGTATPGPDGTWPMRP